MLSDEEIAEIFENEASLQRKKIHTKHNGSQKNKISGNDKKNQPEQENFKPEVKTIDKVKDSVEGLSSKVSDRKKNDKSVKANSGDKSKVPAKTGSLKVISNVIVVVMCVVIAFCIASLVNNYVVDRVTVEGESMEPTLSNEDSILLQKMSYYFGDPDRFDIVVFPVAYDSSTGKKTYYIKRIIGLPGESVQITDGKVYINGEVLSDDKFAEDVILDPGLASTPIYLGPDEYFVLGDNRNMSTDSRSSYVGLVKKRKIVGKAWIRLSSHEENSDDGSSHEKRKRMIE